MEHFFESTIESPFLFLITYLKYGGESFLRKQFECSKLPDFRYIPDKDIISVQRNFPLNDNRGELLDDETNTREFELTFPEFVQQEFERQLKITKGLIYQKSKQNADGHDLKLYKHILVDFLDIQKTIDTKPELNFRSELNKFISRVLTFSYNKFERYYPKTPEFLRLKHYYTTRTDSNYTGFKLKPQARNAHLEDIVERLFTKKFVTRHTEKESILQFLNGEIPKSKIDWDKDKGLHELKFFIDEIYKDEILEKKKKQQWKHMQDIFTCQGNELEKGWHKIHNKLKSPEKRQAIEELASMLLPRN